MVFQYFHFGSSIDFFHVLYLSRYCLFVLPVVTTHWSLAFIDDVLGVLVLQSFGVCLNVDGFTLFDSTQSLPKRIVMSSFGLSSSRGSSLCAFMMCWGALVADATIMRFGTDTFFADRFAIKISNGSPGSISTTPLVANKHSRFMMSRWIYTGRRPCP